MKGTRALCVFETCGKSVVNLIQTLVRGHHSIVSVLIPFVARLIDIVAILYQQRVGVMCYLFYRRYISKKKPFIKNINTKHKIL